MLDTDSKRARRIEQVLRLVNVVIVAALIIFVPYLSYYLPLGRGPEDYAFFMWLKGLVFDMMAAVAIFTLIEVIRGICWVVRYIRGGD